MKKTYYLLVIILLLCSITGSATEFDVPIANMQSPHNSLFLKKLGITVKDQSSLIPVRNAGIYTKAKPLAPDTETKFASTLFNSSNSISTDVEFAFDDGIFFGKNDIYSTELCKASCVLSMTMYPKTRTKYDNLSAAEILSSMGFNDVTKINLAKKYTDNHITSFVLGHKGIIHNGKKANLLCVALSGTDGSTKQWSSNFDVGSSSDGVNHKGFDITANRVLKEINEYIKSVLPKGTAPVVWLTGHSRGGSVANLCAQKLGSALYKCYAYTFGASKTTTDKNAGKYKYIFNIANADDVVTYIPMREWGFDLYGQTKSVSVKNALKDKWSQNTDLKSYRAYSGDLNKTSSLFASCAATRDDIFAYRTDGSIYIGLETEDEGHIAIETLKKTYAKNALPFCSFEVLSAPNDSSYKYMLKVNMQPAFLLQTTASVMSGDVGALDYVTMLLPEYMEDARAGIIEAYFGGMTHPHMTETYYTISCEP